MKRFNRFKVFIGPGIIFFSIFVFFQPAYAYLDPGSGSIILQGIIAGFVTIGVVAKLYWHRLLQFLGYRKNMDSNNNDDKTQGI